MGCFFFSAAREEGSSNILSQYTHWQTVVLTDNFHTRNEKGDFSTDLVSIINRAGGVLFWEGLAKRCRKEENLVSESRVDLSFSDSMRVNELRDSSRKLLNELCGRFFTIS